MIYPCGCQIEDAQKKEILVIPCDYHREKGGWIWVGLQHKNRNKTKRDKHGK